MDKYTDKYKMYHNIGAFRVRGWERTTNDYAKQEQLYIQKLKQLDALIKNSVNPYGEASVSIDNDKEFYIKMYGAKGYDICLVNKKTGVCRVDITSEELDALMANIDLLQRRCKQSIAVSKEKAVVSYSKRDVSDIYNAKYGKQNEIRGSPMTKKQRDDLDER